MSNTIDIMLKMPLLLDSDKSAAKTMVPWQAAFIISGLLVLAACLLCYPRITCYFLIVLSCIFNLLFLIYKLSLIIFAWLGKNELFFTDGDLDTARRAKLPFYSILVPLYREGEVLGQLTEALSNLEYPRDRLEILLLLEKSDEDTIEACRRMNLPPWYRALVIPDVGPRTKPKACCYGLALCRGDIVVIYDAEDIPEPDQLLKAVLAFSRSDPDVICVQARLNYYNRTQNWLTRLFTMEYSMWFDLFLPGLMAVGAPLPLGGTSNHFKRRELALLGGWDPYNVTEDCDLGIRLYLAGYRTLMIASTTWEEANSQFLNWVRQRSRWVKGYMQTYLVHMRRPVKVFRDLGIRHTADFQFTLGGMFFSFFINPLGWLLMLWFHLTGQGYALPWIGGATIQDINIFSLGIGNALFIFMMILGIMRRGYTSLLPYALLVPFYWLMMSLGAYKALIQLICRPHFWEKTRHGLFDPLAGYVKVPQSGDDKRRSCCGVDKE